MKKKGEKKKKKLTRHRNELSARPREAEKYRWSRGTSSGIHATWPPSLNNEELSFNHQCACYVSSAVN
jgi:ribosome assembly protein YihI (activator of Der GTPase)